MNITQPEPRNPLTDMPLYADRPQRRIAGTDYVAVTMYKSSDGTVQEVSVFSVDGQVRIGTLHYQHRRTMSRSRGWSLHACPRVDQYMDQWPTLAEAVTALAARLGVEA